MQNTAAASMTTAPMPPPSSPLFHLPAETTQHVLSFLDFPSLENFRHTSHFSLNLAPPHLLRHAEAAYRLALYEKEKQFAREAEAEAVTVRILSIARWVVPSRAPVKSLQNLHENPVTRVDRLHCFTCYSYLDRDRFSLRQRTGRRSYGHADAMRRFCVTCGFKGKRWSHATYFRRGSTLPCFTCKRIAVTDVAARKLDMCSKCFEGRGRDLTESEGQAFEGMERLGGLAAGNAGKDTSADMLPARDSSSQYKTDDEMTSSSKDTTICPQSGDDWTAMPSQPAISRRAERCVRCWMVDHTYQPAFVSIDHPANRLCESCWMERAGGEYPDGKIPFPVPETLNTRH
jgi:hypothetical protein